jgi:hypothetical protein
MGFASVRGNGSYTPVNILPLGNWLQVLGVYACPIPAEMVQYQPFRDWPYQEFVGEPVRPGSLPVYRELPVARDGRALPEPARFRVGGRPVHLGPEPIHHAGYMIRQGRP